MAKNSLPTYQIQVFRNRVIVIGIVIAMIFSLLASRIWYLQIVEGKKYAELSKGNRIRLVAQAAPRGVIYDRNGEILAENRPSYQLQLIREDTDDLEQTLKNLSEALDIPYASLQRKVEKHRYRRAFQPIIIEKDLEYKKAVLVETYQDEFPGISIVVNSKRYYPHNKIASHLLGYVGLSSEKQNKALDESKRRSGHIVGQTNVELLYNDVLVGTDGGKQIEVDHVGRELRILNNPVAPTPGNDVYLTIDIRLQQFIQTTMKGESGAVVVMRPKTGEVLGMASFPNFNPNLFSDGINQKNWNRLLKNPEHPLENKVIQGVYPPGSPYKLIVGYAGLDMGIIDENTTFFCNGYYYIKGRRAPYKCWAHKYGGHGHMDLHGAIRESCNVYFWNVGMEAGVDKLHEYATRFGFGLKTGIALPNEKAGLIPSSSWKKEALGEPWYKGETTAISVGQGYVSATPLQLVNLVNIIATDGLSVTPRLVMTNELPEFTPLGFNKEYLELIREGMEAAVNEKKGTARRLKSDLYSFGGKTGTAQVISHKTIKGMDKSKVDQKKFQNHAWIVAFGPVQDPEISVAVLVEHGGGGGGVAGPVAKKILDYYFENLYTPPKVMKEFDTNPFTEKIQAAFH